MKHNAIIQPLDIETLRQQVRSAKPFPFFAIDNFLNEAFAQEVLDSFPAFGDAVQMGRTFSTVNEYKKVQIADPSLFKEPVSRLNTELASPEFLSQLAYIFDMPNLLADDKLAGGGMHQTGPRGRLDVHIDFNYIGDRKLHRRLNILIYFNKDWKEEWGGNVELWDKEVKNCVHSFSPIFNRCVIFETSDISYHGVTAAQCPEGQSRKSFAAYYYTKEAPAHWTGEEHSTIFKARPDERFKGQILMPVEKAWRSLRKLPKLVAGKKKAKSS